VFIDAKGRRLRPDFLTRRLAALIAECDLPPVRLHDLRHGAASVAQVSDVAFDASFGRVWERCAVTDWVSAS
jgi:integrase